MISVVSASSPLSPSSQYPRTFEGSGLGPGDGRLCKPRAQGKVRFAGQKACPGCGKCPPVINPLEDEIIEAEEDVQPMQSLSTPELPSRDAIEEHRIDHCPYRDWCDECVEGFGRERGHFRTDDARQIAMISMDYMFITRQGAVISEGDPGWDDPEALKVLVVKDSRSKSVFAHAVPQKGVDVKRYAVDMIVEDVLWLGYSKVLLKSDNEPAIVKLLKQSLASLKVSGVDQAGEEHPPPYDSQANGAVEAAVKQVRGRLRTMKLCLERRIGKRIPPRHPIMTWLVPHVSAILRYRARGVDGNKAV